MTLFRRLGLPVCLAAAALLLIAQVAWSWERTRPLPPPPMDFADPVRAENGMVVSAHVLASQAGVEVLKKGGNAVDAAVATGFALAVVFPVAGNLGGGGFMVARFADGTATSIDYREKAPLAATRDMFLDSTGAFVPSRSQRGYLASGVPGSPAGLLLAHRKYGKLPLKDVIAPAVRLAEKGFPLSPNEVDRLNRYRERFLLYPGTVRYFTKADSTEQYEEGERFRQRDLADVLRRIRKRGHDGFYRGRTADLIVAEMRRGGGLITHEDLARYEAIEREPVVGSYRGHRIISMGPPSSGGVALMQLLNAVEPYDVGAMGYHASETLHLMGESMRRVYADRAHWLGDPDYFAVPVQQLVEKEYMRRRMANFNPDRADSSVAVTHGNPLAYESMETTHYSVVDREGNAVSVTTTINGGYGSHVVVDGAGFFLNNEMDDFAAKPGVPNMYGLLGGDANAIEPGKRMLSAMTPTVVEDPERRVMMVIGTPGGSTIITTVFQTLLNVIDHGMDIQAAVSAPRVHHQWMPDVFRFEEMGLPRDVVRNLEARGWTMQESGGTWGAADGIVVRYESVSAHTDPSGLDRVERRETKRVLYGGADPRGEDTAVGY